MAKRNAETEATTEAAPEATPEATAKATAAQAGSVSPMTVSVVQPSAPMDFLIGCALYGGAGIR